MKLSFIENKKVKIGVDSKTGFIRSLIFKSCDIDLFQQLKQDIPGYACQVRVFDELEQKWFDGFRQKPIINDFKCNRNKISFQLSFKDCPFQLHIELFFEKEFLRWVVKANKKNKKVADRSLRVVFDMPIIAGWKIWAPCADGDFVFDGMTSFDFNHIQVPYVSPRDLVLPMVVHYDSKLDLGFTFVEPLGDKVPAAKFQCCNDVKNFNWGAMKKKMENVPTLEAMNYYIGLVDDRNMQTEIQLCFHDGGWRGSLGKIFDRWREYFLPISDVIYKNQGVFNCSIAEGIKDVKTLKEFGVKTYEIHGHFSHYSDYYQEGKDSWLRLDVKEGAFRKNKKDLTAEDIEEYANSRTDEELFEEFKEYIVAKDWYDAKSPHGASQIRNFRKDLQKYVKTFAKEKIGAYWYFNYTDGFRPIVEEKFLDSIAKNEDGSYQPSGWFYSHNMNSDPKYSFGKFMIKSAQKVIESYPGLSGFFLDCFRHFEIDFAHDDGVTVVNHQKAYSMNFSYDAIEKHIKTKIFDPKKHASFANKPQSIRSMRYVDGVLLEGDGEIAEQKYFWTCLAKPLFFMWTSNKQSLNHNLKRAVFLGCYPKIDKGGEKVSLQKSRELYKKYLPLYEAFKRRVFCFENDPFRVPTGSVGQLYTVGKDYLLSVINENISEEDKITWAKTPYAVLRLKNAPKVGKVLIRYPSSTNWESIKFKFDGTFLYIPMKNYKDCAVLKLLVTKSSSKKIGHQKFADGVDYCGDPESSFEDISKR